RITQVLEKDGTHASAKIIVVQRNEGYHLRLIALSVRKHHYLSLFHVIIHHVNRTFQLFFTELKRRRNRFQFRGDEMRSIQLIREFIELAWAVVQRHIFITQEACDRGTDYLCGKFAELLVAEYVREWV